MQGYPELSPEKAGTSDSMQQEPSSQMHAPDTLAECSAHAFELAFPFQTGYFTQQT
jgi:hypothetical protein